MKVLVINAGSSSLKYQLINMDNEECIAKGNCERIGIGGFITHQIPDGVKIQQDCDFPTHKEAFLEVVKMLTSGEGKVINDVKEISAVGHRVLHGSEIYKTATLVSDEVIDTVMSLKELGPLHNTPQAIAMRACKEVFGNDIPMVAVFDTSFHQTMPEIAYKYAIPSHFLKENKIRAYGFHGTSHKYVSEKAIAYLKEADKPHENIITVHLGNGCSITAVKNGKCIDTSMGFTPISGLIMGTRSGDIDSSVLFYMMKALDYTVDEVSTLLQKQSGMLGLTGYSDLRDIESNAEAGNKDCQLALAMNAYRIKKYIGSYAAVLNGLDAIVFTAGRASAHRSDQI